MLDPLEGDIGDPAPLAAVLADPAVEIVLHAGRQDVAILRRAWSTDVHERVRHADRRRLRRASPPRPATPGLLHDVLKIRLAKSASFTRWDARPLTPEQLRYAREDVEHLLPLADELQRRLTERGRLEWAREECLVIADATDERDPEEVVAAAAAHLGPGPARPRGRARAGRLARADRRRRGPPGRLGRARPDARRARQARADERRRSWARSAARARTSSAAARATSSPRSSAAAPPSRSGSTRASGSRPTPSTARRSRWPRRWCAPGRRRPGWPTS